MKTEKLDARRKKIPKDVKIFVDKSFSIADIISDIIDREGKSMDDLGKVLNLNKLEIYSLMLGTHDFTLKEISKIDAAFGVDIINVVKLPSKPVV